MALQLSDFEVRHPPHPHCRNAALHSASSCVAFAATRIVDQAALALLREEDPRLYDAARRATHEGGMPWTDPRTGITHEPPDRLQIRVATDVEQREAILKWAQEAHRTGSGHDCEEWMAGFRCQVCGSWVDP